MNPSVPSRFYLASLLAGFILHLSVRGRAFLCTLVDLGLHNKQLHIRHCTDPMCTALVCCVQLCSV